MSLSSRRTRIVASSGITAILETEIDIQPWKRWRGETNDAADDFGNRDRGSCSGGRAYTPLAPQQGNPPTLRQQEDPPLGLRAQKAETINYCLGLPFCHPTS